jgi:plasmid maintenance system antidote protein VapI
MAMNPPITPGEILLEEYLLPMGISQNAMARAIGVPPRAVNEIVLGQTPEFWHGLQVECDFRALSKQRKQLTAKIQPASELVDKNQQTAA